VNLRVARVSKAACFSSLVLALLYSRPGVESAPPTVAAMDLSSSTAISCGNPRQELHFEMLAANAAPVPPAGRGLQVCLAVYRLEAP